MNLRIGSNLSLPREAVTQTFAILAKRGAGKTYTAAVMAEEMLKASLPVVIADPIGVWWGLRAAAGGKAEGLQIVVLGGDHGDAPLDATAGELVASLVVDERLSVVLDLSQFRKGEQTRFMTEFAERLYHRNRQALHLILDEADAFAPQRPMPGEQRLLGAVEDLVRRGRARGIGVTLVTQRAAVLNKNVLTQVEVLVTLRTIAPQDLGAVDEWIKVHGTPGERAELMASLPSLPIGTAWFWSPGWLDMFRRVEVRRRETFDSSATPKVGAARLEPKRMAAVDLEALKSRLAATIEKAKAEDPRELRRRIAGLEGELRKLKAAKPATPPADPAAIAAAEQRGFRRGVDAPRGALKNVGVLLNKGAEYLQAALGQLQSEAEGIDKFLATPIAGPELVHAPTQRTPSTPAPPRMRPSQPQAPASADIGEGGLRRMLIALAQRPTGLSAKQLGVRAGMSSSSGTFGTYLGKARSAGWMEGSRDRLVVTDAGIAALGAYEPLPTGRELLAYWVGELGQSGAARILEALATVYPSTLDAERVGELAGLSASSGTFGTYLGKLRTLELVTGPRSALRASEELFG